MLADTFGRPLRFRITAGQASDITAAPGLLEGQQAKAVLADKAYDGNDLRTRIAAMNAEAVIPSKRNRKVPIPHDKSAYKHRNQIEQCFDLDMVSAGWTPTVDTYFGRVTKARIVGAVREAKGDSAADRIVALKKPEMAAEAEVLLAGSGWA